jgi:hypothetical protein
LAVNWTEAVNKSLDRHKLDGERSNEEQMMTVTQKAAAKIAELIKNEVEEEKHVRLILDSVT